MLKVYGTPSSRAGRTLWMCRELGIEYEHIPVHFLNDGARSAEYLAINPFGRVPSIDHDGFRLAESMAINLYLAKKHGSPLAPRTLEDEALTLQWTFWVVTEVETPLLEVLMQRLELEPGSPAEKYFRAKGPKDLEIERRNLEALSQPLARLDSHLQDRDYLLGPDFTVADLNVAAVIGWAKPAKLDLSAYPRVQAWLERCLARPAASAKKK